VPFSQVKEDFAGALMPKCLSLPSQLRRPPGDLSQEKGMAKLTEQQGNKSFSRRKTETAGMAHGLALIVQILEFQAGKYM
jgi:hypothetical protein